MDCIPEFEGARRVSTRPPLVSHRMRSNLAMDASRWPRMKDEASCWSKSLGQLGYLSRASCSSSNGRGLRSASLRCTLAPLLVVSVPSASLVVHVSVGPRNYEGVGHCHGVSHALVYHHHFGGCWGCRCWDTESGDSAGSVERLGPKKLVMCWRHGRSGVSSRSISLCCAALVS